MMPHDVSEILKKAAETPLSEKYPLRQRTPGARCSDYQEGAAMNEIDKKTITLLRKARYLIQLGRFEGVCAAIRMGSDEMLGMSRLRPMPEAGALLQWIEDSIAPYYLVTTWLLKEKGISLTAESARIYRIAWLDNMIDEWSRAA